MKKLPTYPDYIQIFEINVAITPNFSIGLENKGNDHLRKNVLIDPYTNRLPTDIMKIIMKIVRRISMLTLCFKASLTDVLH